MFLRQHLRSRSATLLPYLGFFLLVTSGTAGEVHPGELTKASKNDGGKFFDIRRVKLAKDRTYEFHLSSKQFAPYLILSNGKNKLLKASDDAAGGRSHDAHLVYSPAESGIHQIKVTTLAKGKTGKYVLSIKSHSNAKILKWVERVTLGPEFFGAGKICSRWVRSPTLSVFGGGESRRALVKSIVDQLNRTLGKTPIKRITLLPPGRANADIRVYFRPLKEFAAIGRKHGFKYVPGNWGYFYMFWNGKHEITRGYVLLAADKLAGDSMRHFALEEITQVLGLSNDSPIFLDSVFFSKNGLGGNAKNLNALDHELLRFFYTHVRPGDRAAEVRKAFASHWAR